MPLPAVTPDETARRLQVTYPGGPLDAQLEAAVTVAVVLLAGHVDEALATANAQTWAEAVTALAVKVWDAGSKGTVGLDVAGDWTMPTPSATAGLINATAGLWHPLTLTGGNVIA